MATAELSPDESTPGADVRSRILEAAAGLIASGGSEAATTRAVAAAAGVQAPTIYRLFGDKRGLLEAVAEHCLAKYVAEKAARAPHPDPVRDLRDGWDLHVAFGLAHPDLFALMSLRSGAGAPSSAVSAGHEVLRRRVARIALAGRLRVSEARAVAMLGAACVGTVLTLLGQPEAERDAGLSAASRDALLAAITDDSPGAEPAAPRAMAAALRAALPQTTVLTAGEKHLLQELLDRIADGS
ncbi:MAG: TetR/AcrR family transcriptional regulator [Myxococcales bacterium]|nr:MAG: TetR/AcrR family transcriptional regulator [Myxococcales bacterium]